MKNYKHKLDNYDMNETLFEERNVNIAVLAGNEVNT